MTKRVIGLMGNSGSGKSTVANYLRDQKGALIIDADEVSHAICEPGQPGLEAVKERFDPYFFNDDGTLNRKRMGRVVFADKKKLRLLEDALHPIVMKVVQEILQTTDAELVVLDSAILSRTGLYHLVDEAWLVKAEMDTKLNRITSRDGISYEDAMNRLRSQQSDDEMMRYAHKILMNDGPEELLIEQVEEYL